MDITGGSEGGRCVGLGNGTVIVMLVHSFGCLLFVKTPFAIKTFTVFFIRFRERAGVPMDIRLLSEYIQETASDTTIGFSDDAVSCLNDAINDALQDLIHVLERVSLNPLGCRGDTKGMSSFCPPF